MLAILHGSIEAAEAEADRRVNAIMWGAMAGAGRVPLSTALRRARRGDA
jgi:Pyruvate/2-oxoacid:ferredoxin oxidoreductase gamma subunit